MPSNSNINCYSSISKQTPTNNSVRPSTPFSTDFLLSTDTDTLQERMCHRRGAAWLTDQRLLTPLPPQLITAAAASAAADAFDLSWTVKHSNYQ